MYCEKLKVVNMTDETNGYVYILEVSDIDLPVCKIGMTTRDQPLDAMR